MHKPSIKIHQVSLNQTSFRSRLMNQRIEVTENLAKTIIHANYFEEVFLNCYFYKDQIRITCEKNTILCFDFSCIS
jgi:hypothetical protein